MPDQNWHNERANDFVKQIGGELLRDGGSFSDLMVLTESMLLGVMLVNVKLFKLPPHVSAGLMEDCVQKAIERFTATMGSGHDQS